MTPSMRRKSKSSEVGSFEIILPATSANLGPAFDAAALALKLFLKVRARETPIKHRRKALTTGDTEVTEGPETLDQSFPRVARDYSIVATGRDAEICGRVENHLMLTTYREILHAEGIPAPALALRIDNEIPIGKGCGSSASARLAGIALAVHFGKLRWTESRIIGEASRREHHPDNAAACWLGGLTVARMGAGSEAQTVRIVPKGKWPLLLAVPEESLPTEEARRVLPTQYNRADAVTNIQNSMMLLGAFVQGRADLLSSALGDRMHQPYRAALCPLLPALQKLDRSSGILGVALSGAGPSVLIFVDPRASISQVKTRVKNRLRAAGLSAELVSTTITDRGGNSYLPASRKKKR
jgi:homoserine kinase